jgi:DNA-binding transcriptional LysR family regulator
MELRHLRYFVAVAEELNFSRAAERLHVSQPPLSQQVKQLEEEVAVQLLERNTRWVRLTSAGRLFLEHARLVLAQVDGAVLAARELGPRRVSQKVPTRLVTAARGFTVESTRPDEPQGDRHANAT